MVELQASRGLHDSKKPGWNANGIRKQPGNPRKATRERKQQQPISQKLSGGPLERKILGGWFGQKVLKITIMFSSNIQ